MASRLMDLHGFGQSPWYDNIERSLLTSGELKRMVEEDGISGVTSNPSIFEKAINGSSDYDTEIKDLARQNKSAFEIYDQLTGEDILSATEILMPVFEKTKGLDGFVSLEVSPKLSHNTAQTIGEARRLFEKLGRKNLMIKIPATEEGFLAAKEAIAEGINVNITLIFSLDHYIKSANAYIDGLRKRLGAGKSIEGITSVASFFVSRIDTYIDKMLDDKIKDEKDPRRLSELKSLLGRAAVAQSKMINKQYKKIFYGEEFKHLIQKGGKVQRLLFGSTSAKNPAFSDVKYVEEIIGEGTINTIPQKTIVAFRDHGKASASLEEKTDEAEFVLNELDNLGIDIEIVCQRLQSDGITAFRKSFDDLLASLESKKKAIS
ncbi:MAG: transaldolase [Candidatus Saganbacteria bacterium]|nr:transaldolase [Candidatus Saganbacteria bacterium]